MDNQDRAETIKRVREIVGADPATAVAIRSYAAAAKPILDELAIFGYNLENLGDLRHQGRPWKSALPVLLRWLPIIDEPGVKEDIVRGLSVAWVGDKATGQLIEEFKKSVGTPALAWAVGNALSIVRVVGFENQIIEIAQSQSYGIARQMIVMGLGRLRGNVAAETAAMGLLHDEDVRLHAVIALGKMRASRALPELEKLLGDKRAAIRKEAHKSIKLISQSV